MCRRSGVKGEQGVMMAHQNVKNLMLREDVVWAIRDGEFHNYSESTIDEGIENLTVHPAVERQSDGSYPEETELPGGSRIRRAMRGCYCVLPASSA